MAILWTSAVPFTMETVDAANSVYSFSTTASGTKMYLGYDSDSYPALLTIEASPKNSQFIVAAQAPVPPSPSFPANPVTISTIGTNPVVITN